MRDGPVRGSIKLLALACYRIDLSVTRGLLWLRGEPFFDLRGSCNGCGLCCETPAIQVHPLLFHFKHLRTLLCAWHRRVNGLVFLAEDRTTHTFVFRCTHWDRETRGCDSYRFRPGMCRDYPRALLYSAHPEFFDSCGFWPVLKRAKCLNEELENLGLPPEKLHEVQRKLFLTGPRPQEQESLADD